MKVTVKEEPAWKRTLEIEVDAAVVDRELDKVVEEYRRRLVLPGFRQGKVPSELARKHLGDDLEGEVLRRVVPDAVDNALRENNLRPVGEPRITGLNFNPGQPLTFTATLEIMPQVEVKGYEGLKLTREQAEIQEEDVNRVLDHLRDQNADLEEVDRPAQGGDVVNLRYIELDDAGQPKEGEEPQEVSLEVGGQRTPDIFNQELMAVKVGDMKKVPLTYPEDYPDESLAGKKRELHVTVLKVQEKVWPAPDDAFAKKVLGTDDAGIEDLKSRIRLNLEGEARMNSMQGLETSLINRLIELNPFDLPQGVVESTLERIMERARKDNPNMTPDDEARTLESYKNHVEHHYRVDLIMDAVARAEGIEVTDEDLDKEIDAYAEREGETGAKVKARLKKEGALDRIREDLFRRRVLDRLVEKADVTVSKTGPKKTEETA